MFMVNTSPVPWIRLVRSSLTTNPDPSSATWRSGLLSTSNTSALEAWMVRSTVILLSVMPSTIPRHSGAEHPTRGGRCKRAAMSQRERFGGAGPAW